MINTNCINITDKLSFEPHENKDFEKVFYNNEWITIRGNTRLYVIGSSKNNIRYYQTVTNNDVRLYRCEHNA